MAAVPKAHAHIDLQLHHVFMQAPVAICLLRGPQFIVEIANQRILDILGKKSQEVLNRPVFDGIPEIAHQGYGDLLAKVYASGEAFAEELPLGIEHNNVAEKSYVKFTYKPFREANGAISGIMVVADDVTESVKARNLMKANEMRHKLAMEAARMGSFEWILEGNNFIYSERLAEIFDCSGQDRLQQADFINKIHPDDLELRNSLGTLLLASRINV